MDMICSSLKRNIHQFITDYTSCSILSTSSIANFDQLDQSFMYSKLLNEIIFDIEYNEKAKIEFVNVCREQFSNNDIRLKIINDFESNYDCHSSIWWYTKEPIIYTILNQALRKQDIEMIIKMDSFVQDLHRQIEQIYFQTQQTEKMIIYRRQGMSNVEFEKLKKSEGGLLSFNNFLSTSIDREISFAFGNSARDDSDLTGILFRMKIYPSFSSVPFTALDDISFYSNFDQEILFSMHTIFRIGSMREIENRLWQIDLTLTSNNDQQLKNVTEFIRNEINDGNRWMLLAGLMINMGKFDKALEIYNTLLETILNGTEK
ncbi:unnamed protein product [Rotaria sp. Silwood2]|nr:unnamed protein product [Rotaria sp. Silwood2]